MTLYKLEWGASFLYVGAHSIPDAIKAAKERGYNSDPLRVFTWDTDLVIAMDAEPVIEEPAS